MAGYNSSVHPVELARRIVGTMFDNMMRGLGIALLFLGTGLVLYITYAYFTVPLLDPSLPMWVQFPATSLGIWFLFNILFNWWYCYSTSPGHPTNRNPPMHSKVCKYCETHKPERCHHCSVCGRCVLAMDHHCPWMANCIGYFNYRYFYLFLVYMFLGCSFCVVVCSWSYPVLRVLAGEKNIRIPGPVVFVFVVTTSVAIAVGILLGWHTYLVLNAQTTIEYYKSRAKRLGARSAHGEVYVNEYDLGRRKNWQSVFGPAKYPFSWAMPTTRRRDGDGITWKTLRTPLV